MHAEHSGGRQEKPKHVSLILSASFGIQIYINSMCVSQIEQGRIRISERLVSGLLLTIKMGSFARLPPHFMKCGGPPPQKKEKGVGRMEGS